MKTKKSIVIISTIIVVFLGVFVGVRLVGSLNNGENSNVGTNLVSEDNSIGFELEDENSAIEDNANLEEDENTVGMEEDNLDKQSAESNVDTNEELAEANNEYMQIEVYDDKYSVKESDTLYSIARKLLPDYNAAEVVNLIKLANKETYPELMKNPNFLSLGQEIYIPTAGNFKVSKNQSEDALAVGSPYIVKSGDTLTSIAQSQMGWCELKTAIELLKKNNNLENGNYLQADATIYIPLDEQN